MVKEVKLGVRTRIGDKVNIESDITGTFTPRIGLILGHFGLS